MGREEEKEEEKEENRTRLVAQELAREGVVELNGSARWSCSFNKQNTK